MLHIGLRALYSSQHCFTVKPTGGAGPRDLGGRQPLVPGHRAEGACAAGERVPPAGRGQGAVQGVRRPCPLLPAEEHQTGCQVTVNLVPAVTLPDQEPGDSQHLQPQHLAGGDAPEGP